jgi:mono/diheme cytochrome c family protein
MLSLYPGLVSFSDSAFVAKHSEQKIISVLENGAGKDMKSFRDKLSKEEMAAVAGYVITLAGPPAAAP